jgi:opacity protein-like surface antigen
MKKILLISSLLFLYNFTNAQLFKIAGQEVGFVYVGPKLGTNFSKITNMDMFGADVRMRTGYQIGAVGEIGLSNSLSFETELVFTSKGMADETRVKRVNYLSIPLLAKFSFKALGLSKVYATGGTYNNLRTNARVVYQDELGESWNETHYYSIIDWGLSLGAGAAYDTKYGLLCLDFRYDLGVVDVEKTIITERNMNRSLGVALTFKYDAVDLFLRLRQKKLNQ